MRLDKIKGRMEKRAEKRGWSPEKTASVIAAKVERREKAVRGIKAIGGNVLRPLASAALNTLPFGGIAASALNKVVEKVPVLRDAPVLRQVVEEGADQWALKVETSGSLLTALLKDGLPAQEYIENSEWGKVVASYGLLLTAAVITVVQFLG